MKCVDSDDKEYKKYARFINGLGVVMGWQRVIENRKDKNTWRDPKLLTESKSIYESFVQKFRKDGRPERIAQILFLVDRLRDNVGNESTEVFRSELRRLWGHRWHYWDKKRGWMSISRT